MNNLRIQADELSPVPGIDVLNYFARRGIGRNNAIIILDFSGLTSESSPAKILENHARGWSSALSQANWTTYERV
jgi:hypothetical protein